MKNLNLPASRRHFLKFASALPLALSPLMGHAAPFPERVVTLVVPFAAGAGTDLVARAVAEKLGPMLGQPVVVENRTGAAGVIGTNYVARAKPDGHTLLFIPNSFAFANLISGDAKANYDPLADFKPIIEVAKTPMFLAAGPSAAKSTWPEILESSKIKSESFGSAGNGSILHLAGELVNQATGAKLVHVPYKGVSQAMADVLGGHLPYAYGSLSAIEPHLKSGRLKLVANTAAKRSPLAPDVPTFAEMGFPKVDLTSWYGIYAPKATDDAVVTLVNSKIDVILKMPDIVETLRKQGSSVVGGSPKVLEATTRDDVTQLSKLTVSLNLGDK